MVDRVVEPVHRQVLAHVERDGGVVTEQPREIRARDPGDDRLQRRVFARHGRPLRVAVVGVAPHPDVPVAPRTGGQPLERVVPVGDLRDERERLTLGAELPTDVLHHEGVSASRERRRDPVHERVPPALVVRETHQDGGPAIDAGCAVDVGRETHTVAHRHYLVADVGIQRSRTDDFEPEGHDRSPHRRPKKCPRQESNLRHPVLETWCLRIMRQPVRTNRIGAALGPPAGSGPLPAPLSEIGRGPLLRTFAKPTFCVRSVIVMTRLTWPHCRARPLDEAKPPRGSLLTVRVGPTEKPSTSIHRTPRSRRRSARPEPPSGQRARTNHVRP